MLVHQQSSELLRRAVRSSGHFPSVCRETKCVLTSVLRCESQLAEMIRSASKCLLSLGNKGSSSVALQASVFKKNLIFLLSKYPRILKSNLLLIFHNV